MPYPFFKGTRSLVRGESFRNAQMTGTCTTSGANMENMNVYGSGHRASQQTSRTRLSLILNALLSRMPVRERVHARTHFVLQHRSTCFREDRSTLTRRAVKNVTSSAIQKVSCTLASQMARVLFPDLVKIVQEGDFEKFNSVMTRQQWNELDHREKKNGVCFLFTKASLFTPSKRTITRCLCRASAMARM